MFCFITFHSFYRPVTVGVMGFCSAFIGLLFFKRLYKRGSMNALFFTLFYSEIPYSFLIESNITFCLCFGCVFAYLTIDFLTSSVDISYFSSIDSIDNGFTILKLCYLE